MSASWYQRQPTLLPGRPISAERLYLLRATLGGGFCMTLAFSLYSLYVIRDAGLTPFQLVIVGAALEGATFLCEVPTGIVADALSRRLSILVGTVLFGCGPLLMGLFPSFGGILIGQATLGLGWAFLSGAQEAWLADELGEDAAARLYPRAAQWRFTAGVAGTLVGSALGLFGHRWPMIVGGAAYALLALPLAMTMTEANYHPVRNAIARSPWSALRATARGGLAAVTGDRPVRIAFLIALLVGASSEAFDRLWNYHLLYNIGLPAGLNEVLLFGGLALLTQLGGVLFVAVARSQVAHDARAALVPLLAACYVVVTLGVVAFALIPFFWVAVPLYLVVACVRTAEAPFFVAWVNRGLDPTTRATVLSAVGQGNALGQLGGGPVFAAVAGFAGAGVALILGAVLMAPPALLVRLRSARRSDG